MPRGLIEVRDEIRAAAKAGDMAAVKPLLAEFRQRAAAAETSQRTAGKKYDATEGMSTFGFGGTLHTGLASSLTNIAKRGGQLLTPKSMEAGLGVSDKDIEDQAGTDRDLLNTKGGLAGRFLGDAAFTAPIGGPVGSAARVGLNAVRLGRLAGAGRLAAEGAAMGELTAGDAGEGALWNLGLGGLGKVGKKLLRGAKVEPEARRLMRADVDMTPGQMNPKGTIAQMEQGATVVPWVGAHMRAQRERLTESGLRATVGEQVGMHFPEGTGFTQMTRQINRRLTDAYDHVRSVAGGPITGNGGNQIQAEWNRVLRDPNVMAADSTRQTVRNWLNGKMSALWTSRHNVTGADLMQIRSELRDEVRKATKQAAAGSAEAQARSELLNNAEAALTRQIDAVLPPREQIMLRHTDQLWSRYKPLEGVEFKAAERAGGDPTIGQVIGGLKNAAGQSRWAGRGAGRGQRLVEDIRDASERTQRPNGSILPAAVAGGVISPIMLLGGTRAGSRAFSGRTAIQRGLRRGVVAAKQTPGTRHLLEILRRGAAGALADTTEE